MRTSTTQRRLRGTDLYQPLKLFLGLIWSWGVKLEGGLPTDQIFLLSLALTGRRSLVRRVQLMSSPDVFPRHFAFVLLRAIDSRERRAQHFHTTCRSPECDQQGLKGVVFPGLDAGAIALFTSAQNKLLQSGQEENRSRVQPTLTAQLSYNKLQEQLRRFPT